MSQKCCARLLLKETSTSLVFRVKRKLIVWTIQKWEWLQIKLFDISRKLKERGEIWSLNGGQWVIVLVFVRKGMTSQHRGLKPLMCFYTIFTHTINMTNDVYTAGVSTSHPTPITFVLDFAVVRIWPAGREFDTCLRSVVTLFIVVKLCLTHGWISDLTRQQEQQFSDWLRNSILYERTVSLPSTQL